jgi:ribosomal protein S18 acetylase RimI-like enzyme
MDVLDNPAWHAMTGAQAHLAERVGGAARFRPDVAPFHAVDGTAQGWRDLETLAAGETVVVFGIPGGLPAGWDVQGVIPCLQFVAGKLDPPRDEAFEDLGPHDAEEMVALAKATNPGPFRIRTIEMGRYIGCRSGGRLIAMAGERVHPPGFVEISAVCTDPDHRRRGLARDLTLTVARNIRERGDEAFLHVMTSNENAIALYRSIGFELRRDDLEVVAAKPPT